MLDISKSNRQEQGTIAWKNAGGKGTLLYPPRFGKTATAVKIIDKVLNVNPNATIIVCVKSQVVEQQWKATLGDRNVMVVTIEVLLHMIAANEVNCFLLIVDEIHNFTNERRYSIFKTVKYKFLLGLTGTFPVEKEGALISAVCPIVDTITEKEAIANGWISQFIEYNYAVDFTDEDKEKYAIYSREIAACVASFKGAYDYFPKGLFKDDYDLLQSCHTGKSVKEKGYIKPMVIRHQLASYKGWCNELDLSNLYNRTIDEEWNPDVIKEKAEMFNDFVRKRNELIIFNTVKLKAVIAIFNKFQETTICFNESTQMADLISDTLNDIHNSTYNRIIAASYHSNIKSQPMLDSNGEIIVYKTGVKAGEPKMFGKDTIRKVIIDNVKNKNLLFISTARALDEGLDIPNIMQVITTAGTTNPIQYQQRNARGKTVDMYNPDKVTRIINVYFGSFQFEGKTITTRDYQKLHYRQEKSGVKPIYISDINEII